MNLIEEQVIKQSEVEQEKRATSSSGSKNLELMELSLINHDNASNSDTKNTTSSSNTSVITTEKEHMFDKVVTPSDVGKLNRLVIPKQHAEKYFPLDSSSNDKGLLLNFEDRNGKSWRFRYSYWNSSQSYVMTKGWSRFVKEQKLEAGDIVSFHRGVGDQDRHLLFIDWRRRASVFNVTQPNLHYSTGHTDFQYHQFGFRWGNQLICSIPHLQAYGSSYQPGPYSYVGPSGGVDDVAVPMVIDSVPVVEGRTVGKRLRLFGVNMDCPVMPSNGNCSSSCGEELEESHLVGLPTTTHGLISAHHLDATSSSSSSSSSSSTLNVGDGSTTLQLRLPLSSSNSTSGACGVLPMATTQSHELSKKGKASSLSFDLDL